MNRDELSARAHRDHPIAGPLSDRSVDKLIGLLDLVPGAQVLDLGCGGGEWLLRILARYPGAYGTGVDRSPFAVARAREEAGRRLPPGRLTLHEQAIADFGPDPSGYDLVLCAGSTHLFGGLRPALAVVSSLLRPGGQALLAEGFWERPPGPDALAALDAPADEFADLAGTVQACVEEGFMPLHATVSDQGEWDDYEWTWTRGARAVDRPAAERHLQAYLQGYRGTLGYVTLLLVR